VAQQKKMMTAMTCRALGKRMIWTCDAAQLNALLFQHFEPQKLVLPGISANNDLNDTFSALVSIWGFFTLLRELTKADAI
jgi:hypothetical protein